MLNRSVFVAVGVLLLAAFLTTGALTEAKEDPSIGGLVLDAAGEPVRDAEVLLRVPQGGCRHVAGNHIAGHAVTAADGTFRLPAPPAAMEVYVRHPEHAPTWGEAREGVTLRMKEAAWIEGVAGVPAEVVVRRGPWRFVAQRVDGAFRVGPIPPDEVVSLSAISEAHRPFHQRLVLQPGEVHALDLTLARGLQVAGRVIPAQADVTIRAHQKDGRELVATTTEDGTFTVTGLEAGWVRMVIISPDRPLRILDTEAGETVDVRWK